MPGRSLALAVALALPVPGLASEQVRGGVPRDDDPPVIVHAPLALERPAGVAVDVEATVTDESAVTVILSFRSRGATAFESVPMVAMGNDLYAAAIPAGSVAAPGVEYFIAATDSAASPNAATDPEGAPEVLHAFAVVADPTHLGEAAWESSGCAAGEGGAWSLAALGLLALRRASARGRARRTT